MQRAKLPITWTSPCETTRTTQSKFQGSRKVPFANFFFSFSYRLDNIQKRLEVKDLHMRKQINFRQLKLVHDGILTLKKNNLQFHCLLVDTGQLIFLQKNVSLTREKLFLRVKLGT